MQQIVITHGLVDASMPRDVTSVATRFCQRRDEPSRPQGRRKMPKMIFGIALLLLLSPLVAFPQSSTPPNMAFDITKADVDTLLKNAPPAVDQQLRVVDMGKYNLAVGIIHRGPTNDNPGDAITGPYHDQTAETYIILSGSGVLTTGGTIMDKKPNPNY